MAIDTLGANALASNSVTTAKVADDAITSAKVAAGAVAVADIADGSITTAKLADNAVTTAKITDDAVTSGKVNPAGFNLGRRNLIINGAMQVAQRGTSATGIGTAIGYNTVDRWRFADANNPPSRFTQTQSTDAPDGFGYSHKFEVTTNDSSVDADEMQFTDQFIEAQNLQLLKYGTSGAESITLSFYVKSSVASTMGVRINHEDGGGNYGASYTINSVNTWERKTITVPGNTATAINNDNGKGLRVGFALSAGSDNTGSNSTAWGNGNTFGAHTNTFVGTSSATWQITGVQLEVGDSASKFEHLSFAEEFNHCLRYFEKLENETTAGVQQLGTGHCNLGGGIWYGNNQVIGGFDYKVTKRVTPTIACDDNQGIKCYTGNASRTCNDSNMFDIITVSSCRLNLGNFNSNGTQGYGTWVLLENTHFITIDSEL